MISISSSVSIIRHLICRLDWEYRLGLHACCLQKTLGTESKHAVNTAETLIVFEASFACLPPRFCLCVTNVKPGAATLFTADFQSRFVCVFTSVPAAFWKFLCNDVAWGLVWCCVTVNQCLWAGAKPLAGARRASSGKSSDTLAQPPGLELVKPGYRRQKYNGKFPSCLWRKIHSLCSFPAISSEHTH